MRRLALALTSVMLFVVAPVASRAAAPGDAWVGTPTLVSGTFTYDDGEWIYTDFVYDDYGADTVPSGQSNVVSLAPTVGDFRYPNGTTAAGNAADIVEVRARLAGDGLQVRVLLQSMVSAAVPALRVSADGSERIVTHLSADTSFDTDANTITFFIPEVDDEVLLNIGAGLHDGNGGLRAGVPGTASMNPGEFTTGAPTTQRLFDLAFNSHQIEGRGGAWNENVQAAALASGSLEQFAQPIDTQVLASGVGLTPRLGPGYFVRIFESRQQLGEGMASSFPQYRGRWQPYAVWVPSGGGSEPRPLMLLLHSLSVHHNQYRGGSAPSASYRSLYEQFERGLGAVVVTPLGRGPDGWYEDYGLIDTLEVWADARKHYAVDSERTYVGGYSMGGYGTYRLTTLMPDAFASAVSIVGPPANGIWAWPAAPTGGEGNPDNTRPQLENTRHVPFWITQGVLDELVPVSGVVNQAARFGELGHEYRLAVHPAEDHLTFVFKDEWSREVGWLASHPTRVRDPHRVTFKVRPASWVTPGHVAGGVLGEHLAALTTEVGARVDGAYWIDDVRVSSGSDVTGFVDLSSGAITRRQTGVSPVVGAGVDGPSPHTLTGQDRVWSEGVASDTLTGSLTNVTALTVDLGRAGLSDDVRVLVTSNTPATITLVRNGDVVRQEQVG